MQRMFGVSSRVSNVKLMCEIQIKLLEEREKRLRDEILDGRIQIAYLKLLKEDIEQINTLDYIDGKKYLDLLLKKHKVIHEESKN